MVALSQGELPQPRQAGGAFNQSSATESATKCLAIARPWFSYDGGVGSPYREMKIEVPRERRALDPWMLALLFAWVCDVGRIGLGLVDQRAVDGELGFAGVLAVITAFVGVLHVRRRRQRRRSAA
jgi:hypothetical protein